MEAVSLATPPARACSLHPWRLRDLSEPPLGLRNELAGQGERAHVPGHCVPLQTWPPESLSPYGHRGRARCRDDGAENKLGPWACQPVRAAVGGAHGT